VISADQRVMSRLMLLSHSIGAVGSATFSAPGNCVLCAMVVIFLTMILCCILCFILVVRLKQDLFARVHAGAHRSKSVHGCYP